MYTRKGDGMKTAVIFIGLQASGKTTFYNKYLNGLVHINLDTLHTRNAEAKVLTDCIEKGISFAVDNTDPTAEDRQRYISPAKAAGYHITGYYFSSAVSGCRERNAQREGKAKVPDAAIYSTIKKLERPTYGEGFDELFYVRIDSENNDFLISPWDTEEAGT